MTGKRLVFCAFGSLGDLYPVLSLACEMKRRGHFPFIATSPIYRQRVEGKGVDFRPVRPDIDVTDPAILKRAMHRTSGARYILCELIFPALRDSYEDTLTAADGADLLVTHPVALSSYLLARKTSLPWASVALAPASLFSIYDPAILSGMPLAEKYATLGPAFQRALRSTVAFLFERDWKPFGKLENELGLPPARNPLLWTREAHLVLGLFSPVLAPPQRDWPANSHATGFPFFEHGDGSPPELQDFLDAGELPLFSRSGLPRLVPLAIFFSKALRPRTTLVGAPFSWLAETRETSRLANCRRAWSRSLMLLMPQFFHALRSLFIKVESAQPGKRCVREGPCWWCLTAMTNLTMPPGSSGSASPAAFRANATTQRSLPARSPYSFEKHPILTGQQRLALAFERKPDLRMPAIYLKSFLGNQIRRCKCLSKPVE